MPLHKHYKKPRLSQQLRLLRKKHPYPTKCPTILPHFGESWFERGNALLLKKFLSPDMPDDHKRTPQLILELGVWKGRSTDFMLRVNATCTIICVDMWRGDDSIGHKNKDDGDRLYTQFVRNLWPHRRRVIPVKMDGRKAVQYLHHCGIRPDLIYLDMGHTYNEVKGDLVQLIKYYSDVAILGDDILHHWEGVARAVKECVREHRIHRLEINQNCYALVPKSYDDRYELREFSIRYIDVSTHHSIQPLRMRSLAIVVAKDPHAHTNEQIQKCIKRLSTVYASIVKTCNICVYIVEEQQQRQRTKKLSSATTHSTNSTPPLPTRKRKRKRASSLSTFTFNKGKLYNIGFHNAVTSQRPDAILFQDPLLLPDDTLAKYYTVFPICPIQLCHHHTSYTYEKWFFGSVLIHPLDYFKLNGYPNDICGWEGWDNEWVLRLQSAGMEVWAPVSGGLMVGAPRVLTTEEWHQRRNKGHSNRHSATWRVNGVWETMANPPTGRMSSCENEKLGGVLNCVRIRLQ